MLMSRSRRFVYVLNSESDPTRYYTGITENVRARLAAHNGGRYSHTSRWKPWRVIGVATAYAVCREAVPGQRPSSRRRRD